MKDIFENSLVSSAKKVRPNFITWTELETTPASAFLYVEIITLGPLALITTAQFLNSRNEQLLKSSIRLI
jgi:hypothetical protein